MRTLLLVGLALLVGCSDVQIAKQETDADSDGYNSEVDCDDAHADVNPDAEELCDGVDNDCDALVDEDVAEVSWYADVDGDGYGDRADASIACAAPEGRVADDTDCDDADADVSPGAPEVCDDADVDEDCDDLADDADDSVDPATRFTTSPDGDGDGWGAPGAAVSLCDPPAGNVAEVGDCDDTNAAISPAGTEVCDAADVDEDCDGLSDDADDSADPSTRTTVYADADGDTYGDLGASLTVCDPPAGYTSRADDCDDGDDDVSPEGTEVCEDGVDNDCDGVDDDCESCGGAEVTIDTLNYDGLTYYPLDLDACTPDIGPCCAPTTAQEQMDAFCQLAGYCEAVTWTVETLPSTNCYCWGGCTGYTWYSDCCSGLDDRNFVTEVVCQ